jgi:glycosyltransferase involved in cell wall biosynthesis
MAYAKTLHDSLRSQHPDAKIYIVLSDPLQPEELNRYTHFNVITSEQLNLPHQERFAFRYDVLEFSTAIKPYAFKWIMNNLCPKDIVYLDPDVLVLSPLNEVLRLLNEGATAVLTPHISAPLMDGKIPNEINMLQAGAYNLGFFALRVSEESHKLIDWWSARLEHGAYVDMHVGLFTDQKWMDLAPSLFQKIALLKNPGYNLAYWNFKHREVTYKDATWYANNEPISFVHFSGINPDKPAEFSKYQNRYAFTELGLMGELCKTYHQLLRDNGYKETITLPYGYGQLSDGTPIHQAMRVYFKKFLDSDICEHPLQTLTADFFNTLETRLPENQYVTRIMYGYFLTHPHLAHFNLDTVQGQFDYALWFSCKSPPQEMPSVFITKALETISEEIIRKFRINPFLKKVYSLISSYYQVQRSLSLRKNPSQARLPRLVQALPNNQKVTLIGYSSGDFGLAHTLRSAASALDCVHEELELFSISTRGNHIESNHSMNHLTVDKTNAPVHVFFLSPDQMESTILHYKKKLSHAPAYRIGYWYWEFETFPKEWMYALKYVDEIWAPSRFIFECFSKLATKPVYYMPTVVDVSLKKHYTRQDFNLPTNEFLFLFSYDFHSFIERKNPEAVISAFQLAFPKEQNNVCLVIKSVNGEKHPEKYIKLLELALKDRRIHLINQTVSRDEILGLMQVCDCYISLHRSEGFGLGLAESMWLGKPTIATGYSGNLDFMTPENSCLVNYTKIPLGPGSYHCWDGLDWAQADLKHAASYMQRIYEDKEFRETIAQKGQEFVQKHHCAEAVGPLMQKRLREIRANLLLQDKQEANVL